MSKYLAAFLTIYLLILLFPECSMSEEPVAAVSSAESSILPEGDTGPLTEPAA